MGVPQPPTSAGVRTALRLARRIRRRAPVPVVMRALLCLLTVPLAMGMGGSRGPATDTLRVETVETNPNFPDAVEPAALTRLCATSVGQLRAAFAERGHPFEADLVRKRRGEVCHIVYTPTVSGFRADPDDLPIEELFVNVDGLGLISKRTARLGDSLDISVAMTREFGRAIPITISMDRQVSRSWYASAATFHYRAYVQHLIWRQARDTVQTNPWTQDFLKAGRTPEARRVLVPRYLFEGRASDGEAFAPLLASLNEERFVRSRLSWEGGDVQFVRHPRKPGALVMVHGDSARGYWGANLTDGEYGYVLRREFGADEAIDVSGTVPHADYLVAFLPRDGVALVAEVVTGDQDIAAAAAELLAREFQPTPPPAVVELARALRLPGALWSERPRIEDLLAEARRATGPGWGLQPVYGLEARIDRHVVQFCGGDHLSCFNGARLETFLQENPVLLSEWVTQARRTEARERLGPRLLDIVESQLASPDRRQRARIAEVVNDLEQMGFRVVRVPRFGSDHNGHVDWAGISYVNSLLVDDTLFVPEFGLGDVESRIFALIDQRLPERYRVVPIYARHMLLQNGGIHCTVAIIRE